MLEQELMLRQMKYKIETELEQEQELKQKARLNKMTSVPHMSLLKDKMALGIRTNANKK